MRRRLPAHPRLQVADEIELVGDVGSPLERLHARGQIHRRRHGADGLQLREPLVAELARQLQRQVAAERVAGDGQLPDAFGPDQLAHDEQRVVRQTRVVQPAGEMFGVAAVPLIEADHIPAGGPRLVGDAGDVVSEARALEAVQQQQRRMLRRAASCQ